MSVTTIVKDLLDSAGFNNVVIGNMKFEPDQQIAIYNTGGYPRDLTGTFVEEPTFQIRIRATDYVTGETLAQDIGDTLNGAMTEKILVIHQQSPVLDIGRDDSDRPLFSINFRCYYRN